MFINYLLIMSEDSYEFITGLVNSIFSYYLPNYLNCKHIILEKNFYNVQVHS